MNGKWKQKVAQNLLCILFWNLKKKSDEQNMAKQKHMWKNKLC